MYGRSLFRIVVEIWEKTKGKPVFDASPEGHHKIPVAAKLVYSGAGAEGELAFALPATAVRAAADYTIRLRESRP